MGVESWFGPRLSRSNGRRPAEDNVCGTSMEVNSHAGPLLGRSLVELSLLWSGSESFMHE